MSLSFSHAHSQGSGTTEVVAVLIAITNNSARVLTVDDGKLLPNGPLMPLHRSLQAGVRQWVEAQTGQPLGYIEQLYTFVDTNRRNKDGHALVYVSYMGLVQEADVINQSSTTQIINTQTKSQKISQTAHSDLNESSYNSRDKNNSYKDNADRIDHNRSQNETETKKAGESTAIWRDWYDYFPWENHRDGSMSAYTQSIVSKLIQWANSATIKEEKHKRLQRICLCWGCEWQAEDSLQNVQQCDKSNTQTEQDLLDNNLPDLFTEWVAEHALLRYEMLYEAGLLPESPNYSPNDLPENWHKIIGEPMYYDHRRVIATAISRLRAKIEYRPLIFGLMPPEFTLLQLQQSVEALSGVKLHKQNFRRLLESQNLLELTGNSSQTGRGRPAKLFRFRFDVELQSLLMDSKLPKR